MPILKQPIDNPDAMAERVLDLERQRSQTKRSSLSGPLNPSPALLNPYSLELVGTGAGDPGTVIIPPHALGGDGSPHTGSLYDAQGPQFVLLNGSRNFGGHFIPEYPDSYDLGQKLLPWRSLYTSEIRSTIFRQFEQFLISGTYSVVHGSGSLKSDVTISSTQIDFGQTMTAGDIVLIRADNNGSPQVEYMSIGSLVSGTTYNVTRNLDGSGANAWSIGTVYMVQGTTGDGWIDLDATSAPKLSLVQKLGPLFNNYSEIIRIGDLNGGWGYSTVTYGAAFGRFAVDEPNLVIEPGVLKLRNYNLDVIKLTGTTASFEQLITLGTNGGISAGNGNVILDKTGIMIKVSPNYTDINSYRIFDETSQKDIVNLQATMNSTTKLAQARLLITGPDTWNSSLTIDAFQKGSTEPFLRLSARNEDASTRNAALTVSAGSAGGNWSNFNFKFEDNHDNDITFKSDYVNIGNALRTTTLDRRFLFRTHSGNYGYDSEIDFLGGSGVQGSGEIWITAKQIRMSCGLRVGSDTSQSGVQGIQFKTNFTSDLFGAKIVASDNTATNDNGKLTYTANGGHIFVGNVGIGTAGPLEPLQIGTITGLGTHGGNAHFTGNLYYDAAVPAWKYMTTNYGALLNINSATGDMNVYAVPSGAAGNIASLAAKFAVLNNGNAWVAGNCSADSFTDRTPFYEGDALSEIKAIKGKNGKIDHTTLPKFVRVEREVIVNPAVEAKGKVKAKPAIIEIQQERDLGAMISMLTVAIQQLDKKLNDLIIKQEGIA